MFDRFATDAVSKSLFVLVGLTRLHGVDPSSRPFERSQFALLVGGLAVITMACVSAVPLPQTLTSYFFFVIQVLNICKTYEEQQRSVTDILLTITRLTVISMTLYFLCRRLDRSYGRSRYGDEYDLMLADKLANPPPPPATE